MRNLWGFFLLAGVAGLGLGCGDDDSPSLTTDGSVADSGSRDGGTDARGDAATPANIVQVAQAAGSFTSLVAALQRTGLDDALAGAGPFTVFAPTDAAFTALGVDLATLSDEALTQVLSYHVVAGEVGSSAIPAKVDTLAENTWGNPLTLLFSTTNGVKVNGASVTTADVDASNGVIHIIDAVLLPPNAVEMAAIAQLTELAGAVDGAAQVSGMDLADVLSGAGPFTIFAPTNAAFEAIEATAATLTAEQLRDVLLYHVVGGASPVSSSDLSAGEVPTLLSGQTVTVNLTGGVKVENANVAVADIHVTNGVVHVIDAVMLPTL